MFQDWIKKNVYRKVFVYFGREYLNKNDTSNWLVHVIHHASEHFTVWFFFLLHFEVRTNSYYNFIHGTKIEGLDFQRYIEE